MPDGETQQSFGFELGPDAYVFAEGDHSGWNAVITHGDGRRRLPDALRIEGATVRITLSWSELGAAREITWRAESSWLESKILKTSYAFDAAPDQGRAGLRRGA